ncbi:MAG: AbrB/MazE/SpoVT family DNA-binding domain-containing protein [Candidatus Aenigmarchaeota archaeon]|nr:AbrB/MazE/SpoVT family DNA-binding domain-containing protein [Candidatus Aenigmarchaeota archaeon]
MNEIKTVKISDKGQISIPKDIRDDMNLKEGETLVMMSDGEKIIIEKPERLVKSIPQSESHNIMIISEHVLKKDWDNKYDDRWNKY